jgi:hypothetical protein
LKLVAALVVLACAIAIGAPDDPGMVKVEAVPGGEVTIDGKDIGPAPVLEKLLAGDHEIVVAKAGYRTFTQSIRIRGGQLLTVRAELHAVGTLEVDTRPTGAQVFVDGTLQSTTPMVLEVDAGDHVVKLVKRDYVAYQQKVHVDAGKTVALAIALAQQ